MPTTHTTKFQPKGTSKQRQVLVTVFSNDNRATLSDMGVAPQTAHTMLAEGLIKRTDKVATGKKGRPALVYACTDKGAKRAKRAIQSSLPKGWTAVQSSAVHAYHYNQDTETLSIMFGSRPTVYDYRCAPELFARFETTNSKGSFIYREMKKQGARV